MSKQPPQWLVKSQKKLHLNDVILILAQRENDRLVSRTPARPNAARFLKSTQVPPPLRDHYSVSIGGAHPEFNRYSDVVPYNRTRVVVGEDGYINASWVLEKFGLKWWIASQAPLPSTSHAFLSLLMEQHKSPPGDISGRKCQVRTVVQLTRNVEAQRPKADAYFPSSIHDHPVIFLPDDAGSQSSEIIALKVTMLQEKSMSESCCTRSTIAITPMIAELSNRRDTYDCRELQPSDRTPPGFTRSTVVFNHLLFTAWPDHGVPDEDDIPHLLSFIQLVDAVNRQPPSSPSVSPPNHSPSEFHPDPPIIVGCSAGIGRTGTFLALSSILRKHSLLPSPATPASDLQLIPSSPLGPLPNSLKDDMVAQEIDSLREQRPGMVQQDSQIRLVYDALAVAFSK